MLQLQVGFDPWPADQGLFASVSHRGRLWPVKGSRFSLTMKYIPHWFSPQKPPCLHLCAYRGQQSGSEVVTDGAKTIMSIPSQDQDSRSSRAKTYIQMSRTEPRHFFKCLNPSRDILSPVSRLPQVVTSDILFEDSISGPISY